MTRTTPEQIEKMRELYASGKTQKEVITETGLHSSLVSYYLGSGVREKKIDRAKEYFKCLSPKKKAAIYASRKDYIREYMRNRYQNDSKFREKIRESQRVKALTIIK